MSLRLVMTAFAIGLVACASVPAVQPVPGRAAVAGTVQLVPHDGAPAHSGGGSYGDRRLRDVRFVDYSTPGFTVVYLDAGERPGGTEQLSVEAGMAGVALHPSTGAVGVGGEVVIANRSEREVVVSVPALARVFRIDAGDRITLPAEQAGPLDVFLIGSDEHATVWASPGPWTRVDAAGRFALSDLPPGHFTLRAWRPRFPSASVDVHLRPDEVTNVALEIGVGRGEGASHGH